MVIIVQASRTTLRAVSVSVVGLRSFNVIVVILSGLEWIAHVGRRGWRKVTLLTAGWAVTSSHDDKRGGGGGREEEMGN